jgi:hypothetical protein
MNVEEPVMLEIEYLRSDEVHEFDRDDREEATLPDVPILPHFMTMIGDFSSLTLSSRCF